MTSKEGLGESLTAVEQRVPGEHDPLVTILREPADTVLRVTRRVEALHGDGPDTESLAVRRGLGYGLAVLAPDDREVRGPQVATLVRQCRIS